MAMLNNQMVKSGNSEEMEANNQLEPMNMGISSRMLGNPTWHRWRPTVFPSHFPKMLNPFLKRFHFLNCHAIFHPIFHPFHPFFSQVFSSAAPWLNVKRRAPWKHLGSHEASWNFSKQILLDVGDGHQGMDCDHPQFLRNQCNPPIIIRRMVPSIHVPEP